MPSKPTRTPIPKLSLTTAHARNLRITLVYPFPPGELRELRVLGKDSLEKDHLQASTTYVADGELHGALLRVHLPPAAKDSPFVELEYRRGQKPARAELPAALLWRRLCSWEPTTKIRAVADARFEVSDTEGIPVNLPLRLPELGELGEVIGLRLVRRDEGKVLYSATIEKTTRGTFLGFVFTPDVERLADSPETVLRAAIQLRELVVQDRREVSADARGA